MNKSLQEQTLEDLENIDFPNTRNRKYFPEWISVKERLPQDDEYVLTYIDCSVKSMRSNWYNNYEKRWHEGDDGITHWMNLPSPPEIHE